MNINNLLNNSPLNPLAKSWYPLGLNPEAKPWYPSGLNPKAKSWFPSWCKPTILIPPPPPNSPKAKKKKAFNFDMEEINYYFFNTSINPY